MRRSTDDVIGFPSGSNDERELLLQWLTFLRGAVLRNIEGVSDEDARWTPGGALISLLGVVNHLTHVEWRWIDGEVLGAEVTKARDEYEPGVELTVAEAVSAYRQRAADTDAAIRSMAITTPTRSGVDLRYVVLHLINETARHAGHADATRELLDGTTGE